MRLLLLLLPLATLAAGGPASGGSSSSSSLDVDDDGAEPAAAASAIPPPWMDTADPPKLRARKLVGAMNATEMIALFHGSCRGYTGNVCPNARLGIPQLKMNDGPQGFRGATSTSTAFPAAITIAASWDTAIAQSWGAAMGDEFYRKGANVQLGPGLCLARVPRNGADTPFFLRAVSSFKETIICQIRTGSGQT
jgi:hypothetical protein